MSLLVQFLLLAILSTCSHCTLLETMPEPEHFKRSVAGVQGETMGLVYPANIFLVGHVYNLDGRYTAMDTMYNGYPVYQKPGDTTWSAIFYITLTGLRHSIVLRIHFCIHLMNVLYCGCKKVAVSVPLHWSCTSLKVCYQEVFLPIVHDLEYLQNRQGRCKIRLARLISRSHGFLGSTRLIHDCALCKER